MLKTFNNKSRLLGFINRRFPGPRLKVISSKFGLIILKGDLSLTDALATLTPNKPKYSWKKEEYTKSILKR